ncbi:MAG: hypothetical protein ACFFCI_16570 [Promethearchaeota archaeon]
MRISIEDTRTGQRMKLDVKEHHVLERIIEIVIKHMGYSSSEQRSYTLVYKEMELPNSISIKEAIHKFGLREFDVLMLWSKVIGG